MLKMFDKKVSDKSGAMRIFTLGATDAAIAARTYPIEVNPQKLHPAHTEVVRTEPVDREAEQHSSGIPTIVDVNQVYSVPDFPSWIKEEAERLSMDFPALPYPERDCSPVLSTMRIEFSLY